MSVLGVTTVREAKLLISKLAAGEIDEMHEQPAIAVGTPLADVPISQLTQWLDLTVQDSALPDKTRLIQVSETRVLAELVRRKPQTVSEIKEAQHVRLAIIARRARRDKQ